MAKARSKLENALECKNIVFKSQQGCVFGAFQEKQWSLVISLHRRLCGGHAGAITVRVSNELIAMLGFICRPKARHRPASPSFQSLPARSDFCYASSAGRTRSRSGRNSESARQTCSSACQRRLSLHRSLPRCGDKDDVSSLLIPEFLPSRFHLLGACAKSSRIKTTATNELDRARMPRQGTGRNRKSAQVQRRTMRRAGHNFGCIGAETLDTRQCKGGLCFEHSVG